MTKIDGNGEVFVDFKRKIAWILLASLILGLFGSFSYLMGMETAIIKDVKGQEFTLNQSQKNALGQCKTLKSMLQDCGNSPQIDFEGLAAPVLKDTVLQLAQCIENPKNIDRIADDKIVDLFKLADYLHAPKEISALLAEKVEKLIEPQIVVLEELVGNKQSLNELQAAEYDDLKNLSQLLQKHFGIRMSKWLEKVKMRERPSDPEGLDIVDLSCDPGLKNKLRRLHGIEKIGNAHIIGQLNLANHNITSVDIGSLRKIFPRLYQIYLENNRIEKIKETEPIKDLEVSLAGNPLKSIVFEKPEQYDSLKLSGAGKAEVIFKQTNASKIKCFMKALGVRSGLFARAFILETTKPETGWLHVYTSVLYGFIVAESFPSFIGNLSVCLYTDKYYLPVALLGTVCGPKYAFGAFLLLNGMKASNRFSRIMQDWAHRYPYRIEIESQPGVSLGFPSNYTYNLFGKF